jgi:multiple sugar transport system permease protein
MANETSKASSLKGSTREAIAGYLFILPWLLGFVFLMGGPIIFSLGLSFTEWNPVEGTGSIHFIGLDNFRHMMTDVVFMKAVSNTVIYSLISVPLSMAGAILVALLMNLKLKGIAFFRTIFYLPSVTAGVAAAMLWFFIFQPEYGLLNYGLKSLGHVINFFLNLVVPMEFSIQGPGWITDPKWVMSAYIIMSLWSVGAGMIIYLAGLQGIPEQLYEAADIDGASTWQQFLNVTLPMLSPVIFFNLILTVIGSFQIFAPSFILSGGDGSPANASMFYVLYLYQQSFKFFHYGYGAALGWVLFIVILVATLIQFKFSGWVYYEGELKK